LGPIHDHDIQTPRVSKPLVSIVTPVHNTADYLGDCIRSVLAQSYDNFEYVIDNNASTDGSLEIAESFAAQDSRIRIVNTGGLLPQTQNYNFALRQISPSSRYCKVVQADDWIYPSCVEQMVTLAETDPDIAIVSSYRIGDGFVVDRGLVCEGPQTTTSVVAGADVCRLYLIDGTYLFGSPTTLLYRVYLVRGRDPFFPEFKYSGYFDDVDLCFEVLERLKFGFVHQILSYTRLGNPSLMTSAKGLEFELLTYYMSMKKYGGRYLTASEHRRGLRTVEHRYYRMLAGNLFVGRGREFWEYHAKGLEVAGERLDWGRVVRMQVPRLVNLIGNPKSTAEWLWDRFASRKLAKRPGVSSLSKESDRSVRSPKGSAVVSRRSGGDEIERAAVKS